MENKEIKYNVHSDYQHLQPNEISEIYQKSSNSVAVGCINLAGDINIGMMIRTAMCFSVKEFIILGRKKYDRRSTVGCHNHIPIRVFKSAKGKEEIDELSLISSLKELQKSYTIVFVEQNDRSMPITNLRLLKFEKPPLFLFGTESDGISKNVLNFDILNTIIVEIPQKSVIARSLNVSVSCGILLWEYFSNL